MQIRNYCSFPYFIYFYDMERKGKEWDAFVAGQKQMILKRLRKYKNVTTAKDSLKETGDLSHYQYYKSTTVSKFLLRALTNLENGTYGICEVCNEEIPIARLKVVPAALSCVECDEKK